MDITLITSIIDIPINKELTYSKTRSVFSKEDRFMQLKKTIESVKDKMPSNKIFLVECSKMNKTEKTYIENNTDYFLNIYDNDNKTIMDDIISNSKAMCEGTMTICALEYIHNNIPFNNIFKISGRYWLNNNYEYETYKNNINVIHKINGELTNYFTCFYKLNNETTNQWLEYLKDGKKYGILNGNFGFENIFADFMNRYNNFKTVERVGINGFVSVCGSYIDM
jgi:hypothetical protein